MRIMVVVVFMLLAGPSTRAGTIVGAYADMGNPFSYWRLTGPGAMNNTASVGIRGTDLGHMVNHNGKTYCLFGDTFSGNTPAEGGDWRHNTMAYTTDTNPTNGITFGGWITDASGQAREVIHSGKGNPITEIPTGGVSVNGRIYAWYMAVNEWKDGGDWSIDYAGLAYWAEGDSQFTVVNDFEFHGHGNFGMVAASLRPAVEGVDDDYLYIWGTPSGRLGGVRLARVMPENIENRSQYEFFDGLVAGTPRWTADEFQAELVVEPLVGEMSVMYNEAVGAWTMLYINVATHTLEIRQADNPWGSWSDPVIVADADTLPMGMYAPYMNPLYVTGSGKTIYFTVSYWSTYDVYLTKARLTIATVPGDTNGDGQVDETDATTLAAHWGQGGGWAQGDFNGDGLVGPADASILAANWGYGTGEATAVPEPGSIILLVCGAIAALMSWKRRRQHVIMYAPAVKKGFPKEKRRCDFP